ncbi:MAG: N-acyl-D-glucosamine 2-epimerase [Chloroflexi bacterium]|nr:MAG: N-acyl-D-glucosamine 2-epimerase [Chloroflexota bacterium]
MTPEVLQRYRQETAEELTQNILPFYLQHALDSQNRGFYGYIDRYKRINSAAPKGLIQHTRILWTFSRAYRLLDRPEYLAMARRAYQDLLAMFWDPHDDGFYWLVYADGAPLEADKITYGQAFGIYSLAEYFLATRHQESLDYALHLFDLLQRYTLDPQHGGYFEGRARGWLPNGIYTLDNKQPPAAKSMNTHLHLIEAFTALLLASSSTAVRDALHNLLGLTLRHILSASGDHFRLFFADNWQSLNDHISYGHDIEGSWLLVEAAEALDDPTLTEKMHRISLTMAEAVLRQGVDTDGGLFNEASPAGLLDDHKDWWPQAEAMVGFLNAYQLSRRPEFLQASLNAWHFAQKHLVDRQQGEWFWGIAHDGHIYRPEKTCSWKGPYHNGRACMEVMTRLDSLLRPASPGQPMPRVQTAST